MAEFIGNKIIKLTVVDSTNNYATDLLAKQAQIGGVVIVADEQTSGRGQISNHWESERGKNLLISVITCPEFLPAQYQFFLSKIVALSVADVVGGSVEGVSIKWPNDVYIGNCKVAGILIENSIMGNMLSTSVWGIGLNVNQQNFFSDAPNPVSIRMLTGNVCQLDDILKKLLDRLNIWYLKLQNGYVDEIDKAYMERMYRYGGVFDYEDNSGFFKGEIKGVNEIGQLLIMDTAGKMRQYHFKEVKFIIEK